MTACLDLEAKLKTLNTTAQRLFNDGSHDAELDVIINNYVDDVVLPAYKSLKEKNAALYTAVFAFKNNPSNENFEAAQNVRGFIHWSSYFSRMVSLVQ